MLYIEHAETVGEKQAFGQTIVRFIKQSAIQTNHPKINTTGYDRHLWWGFPFSMVPQRQKTFQNNSTVSSVGQLSCNIMFVDSIRCDKQEN